MEIISIRYIWAVHSIFLIDLYRYYRNLPQWLQTDVGFCSGISYTRVLPTQNVIPLIGRDRCHPGLLTCKNGPMLVLEHHSMGQQPQVPGPGLPGESHAFPASRTTWNMSQDLQENSWGMHLQAWTRQFMGFPWVRARHLELVFWRIRPWALGTPAQGSWKGPSALDCFCSHAISTQASTVIRNTNYY